MKKSISVKVLTPEFRVSYPSVFEASGMEGQEKKFGVTMLFPKSTDLTAIKSAIKQVAEQAFGAGAKGIRNPLRDGDEKEGEEYHGNWFITARSKDQPGVVDEKVQPIIDRRAFYGGCYARATVSFFAYDRNGNKGVGAALGNIQKLRDGEPFGVVSDPTKDFTPVATSATSKPKGSEDEMWD